MGVVKSSLEWLQRFMDGLTPYMNKIVIFFFILFIGFLVGKIFGRFIRKLLADVKLDEILRAKMGAKFSTERLVSGLITMAIYVLSVLLAFNAIGLTTAALEILLAIIIMAVALAVFFAMKETVQNLVAGLFRRRELRKGSYVRLKEVEGTIIETNLFDTLIKTRNGDVVIVPNSLLAARSIRILRRKPKNNDVQSKYQ